MADERKFSFGNVAAGAIITFVISGFGGALLQDYLIRAHPSLEITSVGFRGGDRLIEISEKVIQAAQRDDWGNDLSKYEPFETLVTRERSCAEYVARLKQATLLTEKWLDKHLAEGREQGPLAQISLSAIKQHPYTSDLAVGADLRGQIRRRSLGIPPVDIKTVLQLPRITPLTKKDNSLELFLQSRAVTFPLKGLDADQAEVVELMAESFARGVRSNIAFYSKEFQRSSHDGMIKLKELQEGLRELLLPASRISAKVSIYNSGRSAIAFRPNFGMKVVHKDLQNKTYAMEVNGYTQTSSNPRDSGPGDLSEKEGTEVQVDQFLPRISDLPYINIPPGELREVTLVSTEPLGTDATLIRNAYVAGLLDCKIVGLTNSGSVVVSNPATFGEKINEAERKHLIEWAEKS